MFTHRYRSGWIHGRFESATCVAQLADFTFIRCCSYRAAQIAITRLSRQRGFL